jgi:hypothetical protein
MTKARDIASAAPAPSTVSATELGYLDGVTSAIQTQLDAKTAKSTLTTTGDIYYASAANTPARLGIGSTGNVLTVASGIPSWAAPASGSFVGASAIASANQVISTSVFTAIDFDGTDQFDTDAFHNPSTNNTRMTIPAGKAGKYAVYGRVNFDTPNSTGRRIVEIYKNGSQIPNMNIEVAPIQDATILTAGIVDLAVSDYIEIFVYQTSGVNLTLYGGYCGFQIQYLGA